MRARNELGDREKGIKPLELLWQVTMACSSLLAGVLTVMVALSWRVPLRSQYLFTSGRDVQAAIYFGYAHFCILSPDKTRVGVYARLSPPIPLGLSADILRYSTSVKNSHLQSAWWHPRGFLGFSCLANTREFKSYTAPAWSFVIVPFLVTIFTFRRRARNTRSGGCRKCDYDLRASAGRCPECGTITTDTITAEIRACRPVINPGQQKARWMP
jgi:hypothetical protein